MQPNEQNPNQPSAPQPTQPSVPSNEPGSSLPYAAPDYLHLDPVTGQTPKPSHKKIKYIVVIAIALVVLVGGGIAALLWVQGAPERRFYSMLDVMMQTSYVNRSMDITNTAINVKESIKSKSDLSNPKQPRSELSYTTYRGATEFSKQEYSWQGDMVVTSADSYFARLYAAPAWIKGFKDNEWYQVGAGNYTLDPLGLHSTINDSLSQVLVGNIDSTIRQKILTFIRSNDIYNIKSIKSEKINNEQNTAYSITIDYKKMKLLNDYVNKLLNSSLPEPMFASTSQATFWINNKTGLLSKTSENVSDGADLRVSSNTSFEYPKNVNIIEPTVQEKK